jgi:hypothetical protein
VLTQCLATPDRVDRISSAFDGVEHDLHTGSLGRVLVHSPLQGLRLASFPAGVSALLEVEPLFRAHHRPRQRYDGFFELRRPPMVCLAAATEHDNDACDRLLLPTASTTSTPRFVRYRLLFEACASPMTPGLHPWPRDRWDWHFMMPDPLRRARFGLHAAFVLVPRGPTEPYL